VSIDSIVYELKTFPVWITAAREFLQGKDVKAMTTAAFARARWAAEHPTDEVMPDEFVELAVIE
jgi:hypothetical protein